MHIIKRFIIITLFFNFSLIFSAKVVFDLGDVILNQNGVRSYLHIISTIGPINTLKHYYYNKSFSQAYEKMFKFGNLIFKKNCKMAWFKGEISADELSAKIQENIDKKEFDYFFKNQAERKLIKYGILLILPEHILKITNLSFAALDFVIDCFDAGHELFILSNWDPISIELIKNKFPELFGMFKKENIIISGHIGIAKPDKEIYKLLLQDSDPMDYYFIDDFQENIDAACALGINGILHKDWPTTTNLLSHLFSYN